MKYSKKEEEFINSVDIDYVSLSELARISLEYRKIEPTTEEEYTGVLEFLNYLFNKYKNKLKYYFGPGVTCIQKPPEEFLAWLKEMWYEGKYREIDYSVWFDLD